tara:strand:- start:3191 stop:3358 length:168 start_codon:yes stop_codon:yes gene_type:complete
MSRTTLKAPESSSKRLRNAYFALYEKDPEEFEDFKSFYDNKMEKLIKHFKKQLKL